MFAIVSPAFVSCTPESVAAYETASDKDEEPEDKD